MEQTLGMIMIWPLKWAPQGWAICDGTVLTVTQATQALYSIIGNTYGGNSPNTFALPDFRGRIAVGASYMGSSTYKVGQVGGTENVTLTPLQLPGHSHNVSAVYPNTKIAAQNCYIPVSNIQAQTPTPAAGSLIANGCSPSPDINNNNVDVFNYLPARDTNMVSMQNAITVTANQTSVINIGSTGGTAPHPNIQPFQAMNYIICTSGNYPSYD